MKKTLLLSLIFLASMFLIRVTASLDSPPGQYSPWCDFDDDGDIDIYDIVEIAGRYEASGTPVNKTAFLYNLSETFNMLLSQLDSLNATVALHQEKIALLEAQIDEMNSTIAELEVRLEVLNATKLGVPLWDSGWMNLAVGPNSFYFSEPLNTANVFVYMIGKQSNTSEPHQIAYGGDTRTGVVNTYYGAYWYELTSNYIKVNRHGNDIDWNYVRIMIWKIPEQ